MLANQRVLLSLALQSHTLHDFSIWRWSSAVMCQMTCKSAKLHRI